MMEEPKDIIDMHSGEEEDCAICNPQSNPIDEAIANVFKEHMKDKWTPVIHPEELPTLHDNLKTAIKAAWNVKLDGVLMAIDGLENEHEDDYTPSYAMGFRDTKKRVRAILTAAKDTKGG